MAGMVARLARRPTRHSLRARATDAAGNMSTRRPALEPARLRKQRTEVSYVDVR